MTKTILTMLIVLSACLALGCGASPEAIEDLNKDVQALRASIQDEQQEARKAAEAFNQGLAEADAQLEALLQQQTEIIEQNRQNVQRLADQLASIDSSYEVAARSSSQLAATMEEQNARIAEMVEIYKNRKFIHLTDLAGEKLETTVIPRGAIGEFEVQGDQYITTRGKTANRPVREVMTVGTGKWFINGKEYQYGDQLTYEVWLWESVANRGLRPVGRKVTYAQSNGVMTDELNEAIATGNDDVPAFIPLDGYTPGVEGAFTIPHGTKIYLALDREIKVVVK